MFPAETIPETLGAYRVVRRLGGSGQAEIYLGHMDGPMGFQRDCVLKLMPDTSEGSRPFAEELAREAAICARINHPAIVRTIDFFEHAGKLVLVLEHVEGATLDELWKYLAERRERLGDAAAYYVGQRIAGALAHAHAAADADGTPTPIIHRNLNPENIVIGMDGAVCLTGFGVGKIMGRTPNTAVGMVKGTPGYMAPEQARGEPVTTKADVYGLGLLLWSLLAGRKPPTDGSWPPKMATLRTDLPREICALIDAALDHFPGTRKITCKEIEQWLVKVMSPEKGRADLKDRVVALRAERDAHREPEPSVPRLDPTRQNPFQGVRFGAPAEASAAQYRAPPPPPPAQQQQHTPPAAQVRFAPPAAPAPTPAAPQAAPIRFGAAPAMMPAAPPVATPAAPPAVMTPAASSARFGAASATSILSPAPPPAGAPLIVAPVMVDAQPAPPPAAVAAAPPPPPREPEPYPRRAPLSTMPGPLKKGRPLSAPATIGVSAATATVVVIVAFYVYRDRPPPAEITSATAAAPPPPPTATAIAPPPTATASASAGPRVEDLPAGYGFLTVTSPASANVYVSGKLAGPVNQALQVRCGRWFVRLAVPNEGRYPEWVTPGETVVLACQSMTKIEMRPAPSTPAPRKR